MQMFIAGLSILAKDWKQAKYPPTELINKLWYGHRIQRYSAMKMKELLIYLT